MFQIIYLNVDASNMFTITTTPDTATRTTTARTIIGSTAGTSRNIDTIKVTTITGAANEFGTITNYTDAVASQSEAIQIEMIIFELIARAEWAGIIRILMANNICSIATKHAE